MGIKGAFTAFNSLKVLIVGDVMIDSYLWGTVNRISPEAPVPILSVEKREQRLGGAANVALNVKAMGATPILCSVIGDDKSGNDFLDLLDEEGLSKQGIIKSDKRPTTIKHRVIAKTQHVLRIDEESEKSLDEQENASLIKKFEELVTECDVVIFQDYDKGVLNEENISILIEITNQLNKPSTVDPKKKNFLSYKNVTLFKPNLLELKQGLNIEIEKVNNKSIAEAINQLQQEVPHTNTLITLSEQGMACANETEFYQTSAHSRKITDVSGAGDTVISVASLCLALGMSLQSLLELANLAGGLVCEHAGVVPIDKSTLLEEVIRLNLK